MWGTNLLGAVLLSGLAARVSGTVKYLSAAWWSGYVSALAGVALTTAVIGLILGQVRIANISMLYLIVVLTVAAVFGSGPAVVAAVAAFLAFDFFFVAPVFTLTVSDPEEWVALLLFLLTAVVTGQLAAGQRRRALEAEAREREAIVLYDVVRLIGEREPEQALHAVAERLRQALGLVAVVIDVTAGPGGHRVAAGDFESRRWIEALATAPRHMLHEISPLLPEKPGGSIRWVRIMPPRPPGRRIPADWLYAVPITDGSGRRCGTVVLVRAAGSPRFTAADNRLLLAAAEQIGMALERAWLRREAAEAEVLRRTDELKTALLGAVSHDLRTPLATISAAADSLLQPDVAWSAEERTAFAQEIAAEARRLDRLVNNLLDLSRIEGGALRPQRAWHDLAALVEEVLERLRPLLAGRPVTVDIPEGLPPVLLDYVMIGQVLSNLIENAAKYTPPDTEITVRAGQTDRDLWVEVADRGPGLPLDTLTRIFEPFYRIGGQEPRPRGLGLGLAVAKGLVEAHGGRIWAENRRGGGARFVFTLPLTEAVGDGVRGRQGARG